MSHVGNRRWSDTPPTARLTDSWTTQLIASKASKDSKVHFAGSKAVHIPRSPSHLYLTTTYGQSPPTPFYPLQLAEYKEHIASTARNCSSNHLTQTTDMAATANGLTYPVSESIPHEMEKNLPGGGNWVVQKFGGTSVGKCALNIADIARDGLAKNRIAVVCSARSNNTKAEGTTNRLLRAAREAEKPTVRNYDAIVEAIRSEHISAAKETIASPARLASLSDAITAECVGLTRILEAAQHLGEVSVRVEDKIVSKGEKLSCLFMAAVLEDQGVPAQYIDLSDVIKFDTSHGVDDSFYTNLSKALAEKVQSAGDKVPVITGYFGAVPAGLLNTIGRGYTDLCAALVAVGINADELQVWKEVDGIFTADPRKVPTARLLPSVSPSEAAELTFYGSEVIHPFTMEQVIRARIPIRIKNVINPRNVGTVIIPDPEERKYGATPGHDSRLFHRSRSSTDLALNIMHPKRPTAVTVKHNIIVLNVHSNKRTRAHGFLMSIFNILDKWHLSVDLISSSEVHVSMAIHSESALLSGGGEDELKIQDRDLHAAVDELRKFGNVDLIGNMAIISLVGKQLKNMVGISGKFFSVLGDNNINIEMISQGASEINISCVIDERDADRALSVVHTNLFTFLD
ncbi:aspartate kinase-like protein [Eremomyces bilateralis CBS 781.70]|uniref:Aspartate kinase FUB3 n=1 Tax=Eremomyces bilateralis CBS 781.70 TaxID=1392243 RepID=A0A6G1G276_9PEZI|nr:aspartate kinase-like protein [Eremomyces bilateralis CBS 781.70]KAF1811909.1 aspartate kinase-like protein [Eremomyces bilateralis CBS 781.70]